MKRRVLVAQALVHRPPVIVLDEPTAGVDVELRQGLWQFIRRLNADGHTIILTTHYLEEAEALCGRIALLKSGRVVALDRTSALLAAKSVVLESTLDTLSQGVLNIGPDGRFSLRAGESTTMEVQFTPVIAGTRERGDFTLRACESSACEVQVRLDGLGVEAGFRCDPASVDFGQVNPCHLPLVDEPQKIHSR